MRFSVTIPARNGAPFLEEAIASVMAQSRPADEVIVIDDNSSDATPQIAQSPRWGGRVAYRLNANPSGFADAWNRAAAMATGDFVTILHQDDLLDPGYLAAIDNATRRFPQVKHFYAACCYIDGSGTVIQTPPEPHVDEPVRYTGWEYASRYLHGVLANRHIHRCPGVTTARSLLPEVCAYRKNAGHIADDDFFYRIGAFTDVVGISTPLASFREHKASATGQLTSITATLARDWVHQVKIFGTEDTLFAEDDRARVKRRCMKYINELLFQSIRYGLPDRRSEACRLRAELQSICPELHKESPLWARLLWVLSKPKPTMWASAYVWCLVQALGARAILSRVIAR
jgi:glycosyltransferase involved in cell wall biosynthesis